MQIFGPILCPIDFDSIGAVRKTTGIESFTWLLSARVMERANRLPYAPIQKLNTREER